MLEFEKTSNKTTLVCSMPYMYNVKECKQVIAIIFITDEQPFKIVEGFNFKYILNKC